MSLLQRRFATAGNGGIDLAAVMLFFGRDEGQPRHALAELSDQPEGVVARSGQEEGGNQEEALQRARRQEEDEEERSASEVEV